ncbi:MAG: hypothetical protein O7H39_04445, partial [Gammaproteobacteria bacterium]|nr:hypothetical protein [Gammaproteobacteria bacterium]
NTVAERYRNDSRATADHLEVKLRAIGCSRVARPMLETFEPDEIHKLARMEKNRHRADRYIKGWRPGPRRNNLAKIDNSAFDDDLSFDFKSVGQIPEVLSTHLDEGIARNTLIGVTGHRLDKLDLSTPHFKVACVATLREIERLHPNSRFWVVSALAEGADRYVAELAMDVLGAALIAPLPLPYDLYKRDFDGTSGSAEQFERLVARAKYYFEMPLIEDYVDLEADVEGPNPKRARQYALAGAYIVQRCHEMIAVWDGQAAAGGGGTGDVVAWRQRGVPADLKYPCCFFPPVEQTAPFVVPPDPPRSFVPARLEV